MTRWLPFRLRSHAASRLAAIALAAGLAMPAAAPLGRAAALLGEPRPIASPAAPQDAGRASFRQPDDIPFPADNLYTPEKLRLGRALFFDPRLSRSGQQSCASCHSPALAYGDGAARSTGARGTVSAHRSPTIINLAWSDAVMWDGRFDSLERQALAVLEAPGVLDMPVALAVARLDAIGGYRRMFAAAFPGRPIDGAAIAQAIATFERSVAAAPSPFDAWIAGDEAAISGEARNGFALFTGKAGCAACHGGPTLTDNGFHDIGLPSADPGRGQRFPAVTALQFAFKTPGLREIDRRAPYMHDGSLPTLEAVLEHYDSGGIARPSRAQTIRPLGLTEAERAELLAFLRTLSSPMPPAAPPSLPH